MIPLIGYVDRLSARPGDTLEFKVNSTASEPFSAQLIEIISADPNPDGPGIVHREVVSALDGDYPSQRQDYALGSHVRIERGNIPSPASFSVVATLWPTTPQNGRQGIIDALDEAAGSGFALCLDESGCASVTVGVGSGRTISLSCEQPLRSRQWCRLWARFDAESRVLSVGHVPLDNPQLRERRRRSPA